tara:strand:- start:5233 stop:5550 length:318 start_codon:yes stop_codon:yes gene_type:complete
MLMSLIVDAIKESINNSFMDNEVKTINIKYIETFKSVAYRDLEDWHFNKTNGFKGVRHSQLRLRYLEMVNRAIENNTRVTSEDWTQFYKIPRTFDDEGNEIAVSF